VVARLVALAHALIERGKPGVALRDERPHTELVSQHYGLNINPGRGRRIRWLAGGGDLREQAEGRRFASALLVLTRGIDRPHSELVGFSHRARTKPAHQGTVIAEVGRVHR